MFKEHGGKKKKPQRFLVALKILSTVWAVYWVFNNTLLAVSTCFLNSVNLKVGQNSGGSWGLSRAGRGVGAGAAPVSGQQVRPCGVEAGVAGPGPQELRGYGPPSWLEPHRCGGPGE